MMDSTVLREVAIQVSGYFRDFLESDFKKKSAPRRRILLQSEQGFRCGMRTQPYPTLNRDLWHLLEQPCSSNEMLKVAPRQHTRPISTTLRLVIKSQIEQIKEDALHRVLEDLGAKIIETTGEGRRDAEGWIDEMLA